MKRNPTLFIIEIVVVGSHLMSSLIQVNSMYIVYSLFVFVDLFIYLIFNLRYYGLGIMLAVIDTFSFHLYLKVNTITIGVRAGGAAAPPNFGQLRFIRQQKKFGQSQF